MMEGFARTQSPQCAAKGQLVDPSAGVAPALRALLAACPALTLAPHSSAATTGG